jgi:hypothetical protein
MRPLTIPSSAYVTLTQAHPHNESKALNKPVKYGVMDEERGDLPEDIGLLIEDLQALRENVGIAPPKVHGAKRNGDALLRSL